MKTLSFFAVVSLSLSLSLVGCGKKDEGGKGEGPAKKATEPAPEEKKAPEPAGPTAIEKLGIKATLPAGAEIGDGVAGDGVMIQAPGLVVSIDVASEMRPATLDAAKEEADMYTPKNIQTEELPDGWVFTFENEGGMGKNYFVQVRREIGGKAYWCDTTASQPEQATNAIAVCKSLQQ